MSEPASSVAWSPPVRTTSRTEWLLFGGVMLAALALRLVFFVGIVRLDMFRYVELSNHVLSGGSLFDKNVFYASSRLTLMAPLMLFNKLFGFGQFASILWPLICSMTSVAGVFMIGRELYGPRIGLLAALGMAFVPFQVELATQLMPDAVEGAFIVLAVLFGVLAITRDRRWRLNAILSGISLALAYFTRVNVLVFLPGILAIGAILDTDKWRRSLWALAGLAGTLIAAAGVFWALSGDPLIDWRKTGQFYSSYSKTGFVFRGERFWRQLISIKQRSIVWMLPALALGTVWALAKRQRASWLMLMWAYGFWFYLDVISPLHGLDTSYRYLEPLCAPTLLLFAGAVWWIAGLLPRRLSWTPLALAVLLFLAMLPVDRAVTRNWHNNRRWLAMRRAAEFALADASAPPIYVVGPYTLVTVNYYGGYRYARDTLAPLDAPVNAKARLFADEELSLKPGERALWVSERVPPPVYAPKELASFPGISQPLRVFEITGPR